MTVWMAEKFLFLPRIPEKKVSLADMATVVCLVIAVEESSFVGLSEKCTFFPGPVEEFLLFCCLRLLLWYWQRRMNYYEAHISPSLSAWFSTPFFKVLEVTTRGQKMFENHSKCRIWILAFSTNFRSAIVEIDRHVGSYNYVIESIVDM